MGLKPSIATAVLAGAVAGVAMPLAWTRFADDTTSLVLAFLGIVVLPAHILVIGFGAAGAARDPALNRRIVAWLAAAVVAALAAQVFVR